MKIILYLIRWQLSTPVLALCLTYVNIGGITVKTVIANLIGGILFYYVDKMIFNKK